ncbi:MAG: hypothetical protein QF815_00160, partial [Candidatus Peribacteraceae bacterium]|nr:hypothetical protein [Candidatus Peribacteraceae bacterium]
MDDLTHQFFGDAKRLTLSSKEKAVVWQAVSGRMNTRPLALTSMEKEEAFESIAAHMKKNPIENVGIF